MDRGLALAVWIVVSGWALTMMAMLIIKEFVLPIGNSLLEAMIKVASALLILTVALLTWYWVNKNLFTRLKRGGGPGGT